MAPGKEATILTGIDDDGGGDRLIGIGSDVSCGMMLVTAMMGGGGGGGGGL